LKIAFDPKLQVIQGVAGFQAELQSSAFAGLEAGAIGRGE
jgi:hypothetical protein